MSYLGSTSTRRLIIEIFRLPRFSSPVPSVSFYRPFPERETRGLVTATLLVDSPSPIGYSS